MFSKKYSKSFYFFLVCFCVCFDIFWFVSSSVLTFALSLPAEHQQVERPLADTATEHLWRTLFALVVELSIRSGLVTEDDLAPAGPAPTHADEVPRAEVEEVMQEQGEESANENDPIVEFAPEPDAVTEPRASQEAQPSADVPYSTAPQTKETAPVEVPSSNQVSSLPAMFPAQFAGTLVDAAPVQ